MPSFSQQFRTIWAGYPIAIVLVLLGLGSLLSGQLALAAPPGKEEYVSARLIADTTAIQPGLPFHLGVELSMQPGWHTYYKEPGDVGMATKIDWLFPPGFSAKSLKWQKPTRIDEAGIVSYVYSGRTLITAEIDPPAKLTPDSVVPITAKVRWLSCNNICLPGGSEVKLEIPVAGGKKGGPNKINVEDFRLANFDGPVSEISQGSAPAETKTNILKDKLTVAGTTDHSMGLLGYLALAFVGGMILNFMPCVLPVVAIKVIGLLEQAKQDNAKVRLLGLIFSAGIISSFLLLAAIVIGFQSAGHELGWGFQFQYPPFVLVMATIVLVFALALFGQLNLSVDAGQKECTMMSEKKGMIGTFFKGVLATILSTPCTAPFLGTALGFAFVQPFYIVLAIFLAVGLGMSLPYLLLTMNPDWMKFLPKPGTWMEKLKEAFGFVLLATVAWLVSIFGNQVGVDGLARMLYFLLVVALAVWFANRFSDLSSSNQRRMIVQGSALAMVGISFYFCFLLQPNLLDATHSTPQESAAPAASPGNETSWRPFSVDKLNESLNSGKTVFVDFSAKWCLTCQLNEAAVLRSKEIEDKFKTLHVVRYLADWTNQDPAITDLLRKFGRSGVPLYVIFPAKSPNSPIVLPELIDKSLVLAKLDEAGASLNSK
jgi:thiol:disulfide interchange protein DsbD